MENVDIMIMVSEISIDIGPHFWYLVNILAKLVSSYLFLLIHKDGHSTGNKIEERKESSNSQKEGWKVK